MSHIKMLIGTAHLDEFGRIIEDDVLICHGGGGGGKGGGGSTKVVYQESPESIAYRKAQNEKEAAKKAEEAKIKADAAAEKAEWETRQGQSALLRTGQYKAPAEKDIGLMAEAARKMEKGSEAEPAKQAVKPITSTEAIRGGATPTDQLAAGLGGVSADEEGMFFKKKKV